MNMNNEKSSFTVEAIAFLFLLLVLVMSSYSKGYGQTRGGNIFQSNTTGWETCQITGYSKTQVTFHALVEYHNDLRIYSGAPVNVLLLQGEQLRKYLSGKPYRGTEYVVSGLTRLQCEPGNYMVIVTRNGMSLSNLDIKVQTPIRY